MSNHILPSAKSNRAKVKEKPYSKAHMIIPIEDMRWASKQKPSVNTFWEECWICDPYGSRWMQLNTSLKHTSFSEAKKVLEEQGLFIFKVDKSIRDKRETVCWLVKNLRGSRVKEFWEQSASTDKEPASTDKESASTDKESASTDSICSETLTQQGSCNLSQTSHKHLTNSSKEFVRCADHPTSSENLVSHLEAAVTGIKPPDDIIPHLLNHPGYSVTYKACAMRNGWEVPLENPETIPESSMETIRLLKMRYKKQPRYPK